MIVSRTLLLAIIFTILTFSVLAQRDLVAFNEDNQYKLATVDQFGKQLIMAGPDPMEQRPQYPSMCYITPWNKEGAGHVSLDLTYRLHYASPAWFTLNLDLFTPSNGSQKRKQLSVNITGHHDIDTKFLTDIHRSTVHRHYVPKIVPRVQLNLTQTAISVLLNPKTHVNIVESIIDLVQQGGLPRVGGYNGFDGITLEMAPIWDLLPPYPNDILSYTESEIKPTNSTHGGHPTPRKEGEEWFYTPKNKYALELKDFMKDDEVFQKRQLRPVEYHQPTPKFNRKRGTYTYNFSILEYFDKNVRNLLKNGKNNENLFQNHPRHIVNQFIRKLGIALQSLGKSLLVVTPPFKSQNINEDIDYFVNKQANVYGFNPQNNEELFCTDPRHTTFPKGFSHVDALYLAPYVDYFHVMTYDYSPTYNFAALTGSNAADRVMEDLYHVKNLEAQVRTVATTRLGYSGKRMWRIFQGKSSIYENMYLEDYVTLSDQNRDEDSIENVDLDPEMNQKYPNNRENENTNGTAKKHGSLIRETNDVQISIPNSRSIMTQELIDQKERELSEIIDAATLLRSLPKKQQPMCFNDAPGSKWYEHWNDFTQLCGVFQEPHAWYDERDWKELSRNFNIFYGDKSDEDPEDSDVGNSKMWRKDTYQELLTSMEILALKLHNNFELKKDHQWPTTSYGWSVAPMPWVRNSILMQNIPYQCISQLLSTWNLSSQQKGEQKVVTIEKIKELKQFIPNVQIKRDLVIPVKLERILHKFTVDDEESQNIKTNSENQNDLESISRLCTNYFKNLDDGLGDGGIEPHVQDYCNLFRKHQQKKLEEAQQLKGINGTITLPTVDADDEIASFDPIRQWTFPNLHLDEQIQQQIDANPKYNQIHILAGMNWYGYLYKQIDTSPNGRMLNEEATVQIDNNKFTYREQIGMTYSQAAHFVENWKGQIDIKHDLASGDRFLVFRDDDKGNRIVHALWYPTYAQLHRKLADIRAVADGAAVWECGQGSPDFLKLV